MQPNAVIALQHHGVDIEQAVEKQQPAHGIKPALEQGVADEQEHDQENENMHGFGVAHFTFQQAQYGDGFLQWEAQV